MKKLKAPSDGGIISNAEKAAEISEFRDFRADALAGIRRQIVLGRRIPQILADVGDELVVANRWGPNPIPKLEAVMRVVYEMALDGNLWCINFIADRTEGRPTQTVVVNQTNSDVRDISTDELIRQAQANIVEARHLAQLEIERLIAAGELVRVETPHRTL